MGFSNSKHLNQSTWLYSLTHWNHLDSSLSSTIHIHPIINFWGPVLGGGFWGSTMVLIWSHPCPHCEVHRAKGSGLHRACGLPSRPFSGHPRLQNSMPKQYRACSQGLQGPLPLVHPPGGKVTPYPQEQSPLAPRGEQRTFLLRMCGQSLAGELDFHTPVGEVTCSVGRSWRWEGRREQAEEGRWGASSPLVPLQLSKESEKSKFQPGLPCGYESVLFKIGG